MLRYMLLLYLAIPQAFALNSEALRAEKQYIRSVANHFAEKYDVDRKLILAIIQVESSYRPLAKGGAGEVGLMQLHPRYFPEAIFDVRTNIEIGVKHLVYMRKYCNYQKDYMWIICYNRGFKKSLDPRRNPYYNKVMKIYKELK